MADRPPALKLRGIVKRFPGVLANDHIDLTVERGEIRALLGENGAGKTTLMKVLYGLYSPDAGEILLDGETQHFRSPTDAIAAGLGMVHQHFMLFPSLTVVENVVFGHEPLKRGLIDRQTAAQQVNELADKFRLEIDGEARVADLPVGLRQRVEILKTLYRQAKVLILDEPTAVLTPQERNGLFRVLRRLAAEGKTILFITHKLQEVIELADSASVLRDGRVTATIRIQDKAAPETRPQNLVEVLCHHMVGRDLMPVPERARRLPGQPVLRVENLILPARESNGRPPVAGVSFEVRAGEIVGLAGVAGNGQSELVAAIAGLYRVAAGKIHLVDKDITRSSVAARRSQGLGYVPEDTGGVGLALEASIADNLLMGSLDAPTGPAELIRRGVISRPAVQALAAGLIERFSVKAPSAHEAVRHLSGGNRQKVVVARELSREPLLLIAEHPTQGVDIGAAEGIHQELLETRNAGRAVLLVSADLAELMALADRILVMFEGRIVGEVSGEQADEETLGLLAGGGQQATARHEATGSTQPDAP